MRAEPDPAELLQPDGVPLPRIIFFASLLWIGTGILILFTASLTILFMLLLIPWRQDDRDVHVIAVTFMGFVPLLLGMGSALFGALCYGATPRDIVAGAIWSLLLGFFFLAVACGGLASAQPMLSDPKPMDAEILGALAVATLGNFLGGAGLLAAGILALFGRSKYKAWRKARRAERQDRLSQ